MSKLNKKLTALFLIAIISCASCTTSINIKVTELDLLEQDRTFSGHGSTVTVSGMLHAVIKADKELITYAIEHAYNLTYDVKGCASNIEFAQWPALYLRKTELNEGFSYDVVFDYKLPKNRITDISYNLAKRPEDLCFFVTAANMGPFFARSNIAEVPLTESLKAKLRNYEAVSGKINFKGADYCITNMCRPDYSM